METNNLIEVNNSSLKITDFEETFKSFGYTLEDTDYVKRNQIKVGETVVNGQHSIQMAEQKFVFHWLDFHGSEGTRELAGFEFSVYHNNQRAAGEVCYMDLDDVGFFIGLYTGIENSSRRNPVSSGESSLKTE